MLPNERSDIVARRVLARLSLLGHAAKIRVPAAGGRLLLLLATGGTGIVVVCSWQPANESVPVLIIIPVALLSTQFISFCVCLFTTLSLSLSCIIHFIFY
jgi:hypothetical protein